MEQHITESSWLEATRTIFSNSSCSTCVLTHKHKLVLWQSAGSARLRVEDWQQHGDGMQRVRMHNLGDRNANCTAAVAWVDLSGQSPCTMSGISGEKQPPDHGALAMLFDSGWLMLYNDNGDVAHQQQIFRTNAKQTGSWRPVCSHGNGMLLLTAPNAVYVVQDSDVARALDPCGGASELPVAACPLPGHLNPPQCVPLMSKDSVLCHHVRTVSL